MILSMCLFYLVLSYGPEAPVSVQVKRRDEGDHTPPPSSTTKRETLRPSPLPGINAVPAMAPASHRSRVLDKTRGSWGMPRPSDRYQVGPECPGSTSDWFRRDSRSSFVDGYAITLADLDPVVWHMPRGSRAGGDAHTGLMPAEVVQAAGGACPVFPDWPSGSPGSPLPVCSSRRPNSLW
jgi:hypothetical protein